ncbi:MAG: AmmeMemoRadiSam system radical SAM enzyme [Nitrospira sp.]|nr:AmmeMemoRadiSam system radical SAM enzyme [Nitrospira sp.]MCP9442726.1 AmmeMemoRadiSam system radical SAM enzyme [Nitrospira sp.]
MSPFHADLKAALYYEPLPDQFVRCTLCPHDCRIAPDHRGVCGVRINRGGRLFTQVADRIVSAHIDPIEKKPLFHFLPGSSTYSIATVGCNLRCRFCQNWIISQWPKLQKSMDHGDGVSSPVGAHPNDEWCPDTEPPNTRAGIGTMVTPSEIVSLARRAGCKTIAYTYTEPTIFYELALATARLASTAGLGNVFVTNGFISLDPLREIAPYLGAANIDLKSFRDSYYKKVCGARLEPVLAAVREYKRLGVWIELTTLLIPGLNDEESELRDIVRFIASELGTDVPWHISRFFPAYQMEHWQETPVRSLLRARDIGQEEGLRYIYLGNVPQEEGAENTICPDCGVVLIRRWQFAVFENRLQAGHCPNCGRLVAGRWAISD